MEKILKWKNEKVCKFQMTEYGYLLDVPEVYNRDYLPLGAVMDGGGVDSGWMDAWWRNNAIPAERDSIRLGLECAGVTSENELKLLCRGMSLTNHYWLCNPEENISWESINFWDNGFSDDIGRALFKHKPLRRNASFMSPDASLNGALKKTWVERGGIFYLAKGGSGFMSQEIFNEKLASDLFRAAGAEHVEYRLGVCDGEMCCICRCMTDRDMEFVPGSQLFHTIPRKHYYEKESEREYFERIMDYYHIRYDSRQIDVMLCIDYIIANTDRHYNNIGFLVNQETGERKLAPFFDSGTSLWCHTRTDEIRAEDDRIMARPFCNRNSFGDWKEQAGFIRSYPHMDRRDVLDAVIGFGNAVKSHSEMKPERIEKLATGVIRRVVRLQELVSERGVEVPGPARMEPEAVDIVRNELRQAVPSKTVMLPEL